MAADPDREAILARVIAAIEGLDICNASITQLDDTTPIPSPGCLRLLAKLAGCAAAARPGRAVAEVAEMLVQYGANAAG